MLLIDSIRQIYVSSKKIYHKLNRKKNSTQKPSFNKIRLHAVTLPKRCSVRISPCGVRTWKAEASWCLHWTAWGRHGWTTSQTAGCKSQWQQQCLPYGCRLKLSSACAEAAPQLHIQKRKVSACCLSFRNKSLKTTHLSCIYSYLSHWS